MVNISKKAKFFLKTGFGYDSHRFLNKQEIDLATNNPIEAGTDYIDPSKPLILGGEIVKKDFPAFKSRSDGDVVIHAAVNAILSALAIDNARDIGTLFPNTDKENTNRSSKDFLIKAKELVKDHGYFINDLKLTIKGKPKVDLQKVRKNLNEILETDYETILVQGTSGEDLDDAGKGLGVEVFGICTLINKQILSTKNEILNKF